MRHEDLLAKERRENILEEIEERAAILEFDAGLPRPVAEQVAMRRAVTKYYLNDGSVGGLLIGDKGDTATSLCEELVCRYGDRLDKITVGWIDG